MRADPIDSKPVFFRKAPVRSNRSPKFVGLECFLDRPWKIFPAENHLQTSPMKKIFRKIIDLNQTSMGILWNSAVDFDFRGVLLPQASGTSGRKARTEVWWIFSGE